MFWLLSKVPVPSSAIKYGPSMEMEGEGAFYQAVVNDEVGRDVGFRQCRRDQSMCWESSCSCASCMQNRVENAPPFHLPASLVGDDHGDWPKGVCGERLWSL